MTNLLQVKSSDSIEYQHLCNIQASLNRRLEAARATNNTELLELLEQEKYQLGLTAKTSLVRQLSQQINQFWKNLRHIMTPADSLQVRLIVDASGTQWWYAYDRETGDSVYADSETELNLWLRNR